MKKIQFLLLSLILTSAGLVFNSCEETENPEENKTPLVFIELTADKDTILAEETVTFKAVATGDDINYEWQSSVGSLLGGGTQVTLTSTPCITGDITVTCTVRDKYDEALSKSITVTIL